MTRATSWSINGTIAHFEGASRVSFDCDRPSSGLVELEVAEWRPRGLAMLAVDVPGRKSIDPPLDTQIRQCTLTCQYQPRDSDLVRHQVRYEVGEHPRHTCFDLVLSVQTSLLRSDPRIDVRSQFMQVDLLECLNGQWQEIAEGKQYAEIDASPPLFLIRPRDQPRMSMAILQHPSDFYMTSISMSGEGEARVTHQVFPNSLEKGVIRRARFQICLVPRVGDQREAEALLATLSQAAPILNS